MKTSEERAAYYKGKYEALKEKMSDTRTMIKQSIIDHTVRYIIIGLIVVGGAFGTYYYVSHKVTETVTEIKKDVKEAIPHPIDATKKWFKKGSHWWNKDTNQSIVVEAGEIKEVSKILNKDKNKTSWTDKLKNLKFWGKKKD